MSQKAGSRRGRRIQADIRAVLEESWDPIGLFPGGPTGEYDSYIGDVYRLLVSDAGEPAVTRYLADNEAALLGDAPGVAERAAEAARRLVALDVSLGR